MADDIKKLVEEYEALAGMKDPMSKVPEALMPDPAEDQKKKQDVANKAVNSEVSSANASDPSMKKPKTLESLMTDYLAGREKYESKLDEARGSDAKMNAILKAGQALANLGQSKMATESGVPIKQTEFKDPSIDTSSTLSGDRDRKLQELLTAKKLQDIAKSGQDKGLSEYQKAMLAARNRELDIREKGMEKDTSMTEYQRRMADLRERELDDKGKEKPLNLSKAQETVDKEFGKTYQEYVAKGGSADAKKQLNQLKEAKKELESGKVEATGAKPGLIGKTGRDLLYPEGAAIEDAVQEVVQRNLRLILGAQFTEREGEMLLARAYNPRLSEKENAKRLGRLIDQMEDAIKAKEAAADYFEQKGTLKGFKGQLDYTAADFMQESSRDAKDFSGRAEGDTWEDDTHMYRVVNGQVQKKAK